MRTSEAFVSTGALRGFTADDAICAWANTWTAALQGHDTVRQGVAADELNSARVWSAVVELDSVQQMKTGSVIAVAPDGSRQVMKTRDSTRFGYLSLVRSAIANSDPAALGTALVDNVRCIPELMPDLPAAVRQLNRAGQ